MIESRKSPKPCTFGILNPPFIKTPVLCLCALTSVLVLGAVSSTQYQVSQADSFTPHAMNTFALQYYKGQITTASQVISEQLKFVQKRQTQLALARDEAAKKALKSRQVSIKKVATKPNASGKVIKTTTTTSLAYAPLKEGSHTFYAGQCTRYVASQKTIPWGGNAGDWLTNAAAEGYQTSKTPKAGAVIVTNESRTGHVGIVESIKGDKMVISEMNYAGWGKVTKREIPLDSSKIKGYITDARVTS